MRAMWHRLPEQQQRGVQIDGRGKGEAPADAVKDRAAQDHEQAGGDPGAGKYPASRLEDRDQDITPDDPRPEVDWDERVQPERADEREHERQGD
jgi:hypothetical protein